MDDDDEGTWLIFSCKTTKIFLSRSTMTVDHIPNRDNLHVKEVTCSDESQQIKSKTNNSSPIQKRFVIFV